MSSHMMMATLAALALSTPALAHDPAKTPVDPEEMSILLDPFEAPIDTEMKTILWFEIIEASLPTQAAVTLCKPRNVEQSCAPPRQS
jgi:hypothetical protein